MRLYEKMIHNRVTNLIKIHPSQAGFRKKHSTDDNLYRLLETLYTNLWSSTNRFSICIPVIFLDLQKAFDKMDIDSVLYKLVHNKGLSTNSRIIHFFKAFLSNRYLRTVTLKSTSNWKNITIGTPQGTILGPFLFLVYIDDLIQEIEKNQLINGIALPSKCEAPGYADDIYLIPRSLEQPVDGTMGDVQASEILHRKIDDLQEALSICGKWARNWCMTFSLDKTNIMLFRKHDQLLNPDKYLSDKVVLQKAQSIKLIQSNNINSSLNFTIQRVEQYKYMGLTLSGNGQQLFNPHIDNIIKLIRTRGYQVRRVLKPSMPIRIAHLLVKAMVYSILQYALAFIRFNTETVTNNIISALRVIWRYILHVPSFTNNQDMMKELCFPSLQTLHQYYLLKYIKRTLSKDGAQHSGKALLERNIQKAKFMAANGNTTKGDTRPYIFRQVTLEYRELLGKYSSAQLTHTVDRVWPDPTKSTTEQLYQHCMHLGFSDWAYSRSTDKGLSSIILSTDQIDRVKHQQKIDSEYQQTNKLVQSIAKKDSKRRGKIQAPKHISNQPKLNINKNNDETNTHTITINNKHSLEYNPSNCMEIPLHHIYLDHNPIQCREIEQIRLDVTPTLINIKSKCYTILEQNNITKTQTLCRKCKLYPETTEHVFLECEAHMIKLHELQIKLQIALEDNIKVNKKKRGRKLKGSADAVPVIIIPELPINMKTLACVFPHEIFKKKIIAKAIILEIGNYIHSVYKSHILPIINNGFRNYLNFKPP
jgi:hypothetical protein